MNRRPTARRPTPASQPESVTSPARLLQELRQQFTLGTSEVRFSSGWPALDRLLPGGGVRRGSLTEWFVEPGVIQRPASGGAVLALRVAWQACQADGVLADGVLAVVDPWQTFYPPAAAAWGLDLNRLLLIRPRSAGDTLWAVDQCLRCPAVKAVWSDLESINDRWFRRFQLAAESSGCVGVFVRPLKFHKHPSWSEMQFIVTGLEAAEGDQDSETDWPLQVTRIRCRRQWCSGQTTTASDTSSSAPSSSEMASDSSPTTDSSHTTELTTCEPTLNVARVIVWL